MALNEQELQTAGSLKDQGYSSSEIKAYIGATRTGRQSSVHLEESERQKMSSEFAQRDFDIGEMAEKFTSAIGLEGTVDVLGRDIARGKFGEAITGVDTETLQEGIEPTTQKERAGAALQLGSTAAGFAIAGPSSLLGQMAVGAGLGYLYDVGSDTIDNKSLAEIATPGGATIAGGLIPVPLRAAGAGLSSLSRGIAKKAGEGVEAGIETNIKSFVDDMPGQGIVERGKNLVNRFPRAYRHIAEYVDEGAEIAEKKKTGSTNVVNALDEGVDMKTVEFVENFDQATNQSALKMMDLAEAPRGSATPQSVPAKHAGEQFKLVVDKRKAVGEQIGELADELPDETFDMLQSLRGLRQTMMDNGLMPFKDGIRFQSKNYTPKQKDLIQQAYDLATADEKLSARQIHQMDQLFSKLQREARFEGLDDVFVKVKGSDGATHDVNLFKMYRNVFNEKLNTISGGRFREVNSQYAFYRNLQDDLEGTIFKGAQEANLKIDPSEPAENNMRRIFSNAQSQPKFRAAYDALDATSRELGYEGPNATTLYDFYLHDMKPLYPDTVRPTSFEGGIRGALSSVVDTVSSIGKSTEADKARALRGLLDPDSLRPVADVVEDVSKKVDDFFEKPPKKGTVQKIKDAISDERGSVKLGGESESQKVKGLVESSKDINTLSPKGEEVVNKYLKHIDGTQKLTGDELINVKADVQVIAERAGLTSATKGDKALANELADKYQKQVSDFKKSVTNETTDLATEAKKYDSADSTKNTLPDVENDLVDDLFKDIEQLKNNVGVARTNIDELTGRTDTEMIEIGKFDFKTKQAIKDIASIIGVEPALKKALPQEIKELMRKAGYAEDFIN